MAEDFQKQLEMLNMDTRAFQHLEEEIKKVIQELSEDANMERFRREFEKLYTALKGSHEREATHLKKCRELNDSIIQDTFGVKIQITPQKPIFRPSGGKNVNFFLKMSNFPLKTQNSRSKPRSVWPKRTTER